MKNALRAHLAAGHFHSAASCVAGEPEAVCVLVEALAALVGNGGYVEGALGTVIHAALGTLLPLEEEEEDMERAGGGM